MIPWLGAAACAAVATPDDGPVAAAAACVCLALAAACDTVSLVRLIRQVRLLRTPGGPARQSALLAAELNLTARALAACAYLFLAGGTRAGAPAAVAVLLVVLTAGRHQMTRYELGARAPGPG
jgi:hypothetical protein